MIEENEKESAGEKAARVGSRVVSRAVGRKVVAVIASNPEVSVPAALVVIAVVVVMIFMIIISYLPKLLMNYLGFDDAAAFSYTMSSIEQQNLKEGLEDLFGTETDPTLDAVIRSGLSECEEKAAESYSQTASSASGSISYEGYSYDYDYDEDFWSNKEYVNLFSSIIRASGNSELIASVKNGGSTSAFEESEENTGSYEEKTVVNVIRDCLWFGDDQIVNIYDSLINEKNRKISGAVLSGTYVYYGLDGSGCSWMEEHKDYVYSFLNDHPKGAVVLFSGFNDIRKAEDYIALYQSLIDSYPDANFVIVGLFPIDEETARQNGYSLTNRKIEAFNEKLSAAFPDNFFDTYGKISVSSYKRKDGVMLTETAYKRLFAYIRGNASLVTREVIQKTESIEEDTEAGNLPDEENENPDDWQENDGDGEKTDTGKENTGKMVADFLVSDFKTQINVPSFSFSLWEDVYADTLSLTAEQQTTVGTIITVLKKNGLNDAAIAGVLANIYNESGFSSTNLQDSYEHSMGYSDFSYTNAVDSGAYSRSSFINDSAGYGLVQFTASGLKEGLYDYVKENGKSIGDTVSQTEYLVASVKQYNGNLWNQLLAVSNTSEGAYQAGYAFCAGYERPADTAARSAVRGNMARDTIWAMMQDGSIKAGGAVLQSLAEKVYWVGDSRTCQLYGALKKQNAQNEIFDQVYQNTTFTAKGGEGIWWWSTAESHIAAYLDRNRTATVVLALGVNGADMSNWDECIEKYQALMEDYPSATIMVLSITPVDDAKMAAAGYTVRNSHISEWNSKLQAAFPDNFIDAYSYMMSSGFTTDAGGLHYDNTTSKKIYEYVMQQLECASSGGGNTILYNAVSNGTIAQMANSGIGENGGWNNQPGDQLGSEVTVKNWYKSHGAWDAVLIYEDYGVMAEIAEAFVKLCDCDLVGYDQCSPDRITLYQALEKYNWNVDAYIASGELTECDCSSAVYTVCCIYIPEMRSYYETNGEAPRTYGMEDDLYAQWGWTLLRDSRYLESGDYQIAGMIYLNNAHTNMASNNGCMIASVSGGYYGSGMYLDLKTYDVVDDMPVHGEDGKYKDQIVSYIAEQLSNSRYYTWSEMADTVYTTEEVHTVRYDDAEGDYEEKYTVTHIKKNYRIGLKNTSVTSYRAASSGAEDWKMVTNSKTLQAVIDLLKGLNDGTFGETIRNIFRQSSKSELQEYTLSTQFLQQLDRNFDYTELVSGGSTNSSGTGDGTYTDLGDEQLSAYNYFVSCGCTPEGACAIMGNLALESGWDEENYSSSLGYNCGYFGTTEKTTNNRMVQYCESQGVETFTPEGQCMWIIYWLQTDHSATSEVDGLAWGDSYKADKISALWEYLCTTDDWKTATAEFCQIYEECDTSVRGFQSGVDEYYHGTLWPEKYGNGQQGLKLRYDLAEEYYGTYKDYAVVSSANDITEHTVVKGSIMYCTNSLGGRKFGSPGDTTVEVNLGEDITGKDGTKGSDIIAYGIQYVGNAYVWGGSSLTDGCDCSGYVMAVLAHFGISFPHYSYDAVNYGTPVDMQDVKLGDVIIYNGGGHVAFYMGDNKMLEAEGEAYGIVAGNRNAFFKDDTGAPRDYVIRRMIEE